MLPRLNGYVECSNRTHTLEFYKVTDAEIDSFDMPGIYDLDLRSSVQAKIGIKLKGKGLCERI